MVATADEVGLVSVRFPLLASLHRDERGGLDTDRGECFCDSKNVSNHVRQHSVLINLESELTAYFAGKLTVFTTPLSFTGTPFQNKVWKALQQIPLGQTCSYKELAQAIGKPTAFRAVALANRANQFAVIVPCHRVIRANGDLCGYNGGVELKKWLLHHEQNYKAK